MSPELQPIEIVTAADTGAGAEIPTDFYQPRVIVLTDEVNTRNAQTGAIEKKEVEFTHRTTRLENNHWIAFNDTLNARRRYEGSKPVYKDDLTKAVNETYKKLVRSVPEGYAPYFRQQLTDENFHELIPFKDKEKVLDRAFVFEISESAEQEFFFDDAQENKFEIDVPINGENRTGIICLRPKLKADEKAYKTATEPNVSSIKRFRNPEIPLKNDYKKISELFDSLKTFAGVFENEAVPVWIQNGLMAYYFTEFGERDAKN